MYLNLNFYVNKEKYKVLSKLHLSCKEGRILKLFLELHVLRHTTEDVTERVHDIINDCRRCRCMMLKKPMQ